MKLYRIVILIVALVLIAGCSQVSPAYPPSDASSPEPLYTEVCHGLVCVLDFADGNQCVYTYHGGIHCKWPKPE
jgi:hypothetical protein